MDIETLVGALTANERDELLEQLTTAAESTDNETDDAQDTSGCCGGPHSKAHRHPTKSKTLHMCCAG
ncbi:MAG: hypothetical protein BMS9Abin17_0202 [Acidimicrobiia bacterium]|nr:MAG: hypothetical protein BMS9Abin17_0202 [Acidimicrobiia bacterium]